MDGFFPWCIYQILTCAGVRGFQGYERACAKRQKAKKKLFFRNLIERVGSRNKGKPEIKSALINSEIQP